MTNIPVLHARFAGFSEDERAVLHFALQQQAARIMDKASAGQYGRDDLAGAAATFHMASTLAGELGVTLGERAPDPESLDMVAVCIAEGEAPFAARMAAEVQEESREAPRPLGAHADIPVTPGEDEATA